MRLPSHLSLAGRRLVGALAVLATVALVAMDSDRGAAIAVGDRVAVEVPASDPASAEVVAGGDPGSRLADGAEDGADLGELRVHVVEPGDTAGDIAERHGVRTSAFTRANRHVRPEALHPGMRLVVPDPDALRPRTPEQAMAAELELEALFDEVAGATGWNPALVKAVAWVESRWDHHVVSDRGAIGVMQVQPATGELMAERVGRPLDLHDLRDNVEAGVAYLDFLHERYGDDTRALLAAYHQGPQAVRDRGILRVSDRYADQILALRDTFGAGG
jgi:hypothetical protein